MPVNKKKKVNRKKKQTAKKKVPRRIGPKPVVLDELKKILLGAVILVSICLTIAMVADIVFKPGQHANQISKGAESESAESGSNTRKTPSESQSSDKPLPVYQMAETEQKSGVKGQPVKTKTPSKNLKPKPGKTSQKKADPGNVETKSIEYEVFDDADHGVTEKPVPRVKGKILKIAIIIDDIGYDKKIPIAMHTLNPNITFSVLPFSPYGKSLTEKLHKRGAELMLHLPMEPAEYPQVNPGPGAILSQMPPDVVIARLQRAIDNVPYIVGVNNHMGSGLTTQEDKMNQIFSILKTQSLFFIDSRTASASKCLASARLIKLSFAQRDVFLDNIQDTDYISGQFKKLLRQAEKHGSAIGIGHPYPTTLDALAKEIPRLKKQVQIVRASQLTHVPN